MNSKYIHTFLIFILTNYFFVKSQSLSPTIKSREILLKEGYNPLAPAKSAFYSAIIPGLGQAYNKDFWKVPIVYGALAIPIYYYSINNTSYKRYRRAFKIREANLQDEFTLDDGTELISKQGLMNAQRILKQNRDTSLLTFIGLYILQILEASVSAHLLQFNIDDKISLDSNIYLEPITNNSLAGLSININF